MIATIKSEVRKFLTIRSTYAFLLVMLAMLGLFAFYIGGMRAGAAVNDPNKLANDVVGAVQAIAILIAIMGALIMTHEYRYNTIMYTLTSSRSRLQILLAKILVVSAFSVVIALVVGTLSPLMSYFGAVGVKGLELVPQNIPYMDLAWRAAFTGWAYGMAGLLFATLIRNQVGTIITILFVPSTIESLLSLLLRSNSIYLPFTALAGVMQNMQRLSHGKAALIFLGYLIVGWIIAAILFKRRDAN
jgi:ABC-2 type transport system permease protein